MSQAIISQIPHSSIIQTAKFQIQKDNIIHSVKISQLADDTTLYLGSEQDVQTAIDVIERFSMQCI